ncbi:MAG TPA: signal recognition particle receptor subunit alpha, partial [bacterium]|nr:signal recognition particle receptor subunit alpha [bacterium]
MDQFTLETIFSFSDQYFDLLIAIGLFLCLMLFRIHRLQSARNRFSQNTIAPALNKTNFALSLKKLLLGTQKQLDELLPELEEVLLAADVGVGATEKLLASLKEHSFSSKEDIFLFIKERLKKTLSPQDHFSIDPAKKPYVIYLAGVNGSGKTTTIGKLANQFKQQGHKGMLVAADTFRAAAVDQLRIWAKRNAVAFVGGAV